MKTIVWLGLLFGVMSVTPGLAKDLEILGVRGLEGGEHDERDEDGTRRVILPLQALPREDYRSDRTNPCGPYAVTAVLRYSGKQDADFFEIARRMTPNDSIGSALTTVMRNLLDGGVRVASRSQAKIGDIVTAIDGGNPVVTLVDAENVPHWAVVKGYEMEAGQVVAFYLEDTFFAWGERRRERERLPDGFRIEIEQFVRVWRTPLWPEMLGGIASRAAGYGNTMIVAHLDGGGSSDIPLFAVNPVTAISTGALDTWIGLRDLSPGRILGGLGQLASGVAMFGPHALGAGIEFAGRNLDAGGRWLQDHLGPVGPLVGWPARAAGATIQAVGGGVKKVTNGVLGVASRIFG